MSLQNQTKSKHSSRGALRSVVLSGKPEHLGKPSPGAQGWLVSPGWQSLSAQLLIFIKYAGSSITVARQDTGVWHQHLQLHCTAQQCLALLHLCLLMRSHCLFIPMLFFFPVSGMSSIKPVLSVFIMLRFVMIVN